VFEHGEPPAGLEHAARFGQRRALVGDGAQREGEHDGVEGGFGEGQRFRAGGADLEGHCGLREFAFELGAHRRARFDRDDAGSRA